MRKYFWDAVRVTPRTWAEVGPILKRRREIELGLTQPQLAERADLSVPMIQVLEGGRRDSFSGVTIGKIARGLAWPSDAIERLLAGERPEDLAAEIDLNSAAAELTPDERRAVLDFIAKQRRKQR